jgi:WD40 repeat protein
VLAETEALEAAQIADDGGAVRLYWTESDMLRLGVLGAGMWTVDPPSGEVTALGLEALWPVLWAPDGERRATVEFAEGVSTIRVLDEQEEELVSTTVSGRVSHLRWSPTGERVVFTRGTSAPNGGVLQDLFLWDLNGQPPMQLTNTGRSFGAEWRGSQPLWRD